MIDRDEDGRPVNAFFTEAEMCESCGEPTTRPRVWNTEHELWVAIDCSCNAPSVPTCPALIPALERADTVREVCQVIREHRASCPLCGPVEIRKEPAVVWKEAA